MAAFWTLTAAATLAKLLLMPTYRSTDFEVHRNWLAITHSLPLREWYTDETSEWTLDYPPFFAWFEYALSCLAVFFDPAMLEVSNLYYASEGTILFQRLSVIAVDFIYFYAIKEFFDKSFKDDSSKNKFRNFGVIVISTLLIFNMGLFIVDHIHFQYNGMLFGIMLLSIVRLFEGKNIEGAFWFSVLLNMKHIFLFISPAFFVYLLRIHCFKTGSKPSVSTFSLKNFLALGTVVVLIFLLSIGPFFYMGQLFQLISRMFPVKRGLVHAYWAPNFWALYTGVDKILCMIGLKLKFIDEESIPSASMTGGMVQEYSHTILPSVLPSFTVLFTACAMLPALHTLWMRADPVTFLRTLVLCAFTSFMFGYHVHEKAVLMIIIPMTLLVISSQLDAKIFVILSTVGHYSLFPLLFTPFENLIKVCLFLLSVSFTLLSVSNIHSNPKKERLYSKSLGTTANLVLPALNILESLYLWGLIPLGLFNSLGFWALGLSSRLPFLPLLLTSIYCALGISYCFVLFYKATIFNDFNMQPHEHREKKRR